MRTIHLASISLFTLVVAGAPAPASAQGGSEQRAPSVELQRAPSTPQTVSRAADRVVPQGAARTTASTATPIRPATMQNGILKTQPPRWSTEAVSGPNHVRINPNPPQVREIPNTAKRTLANPESRARFDASRQTRTARLVNPKPAGQGGVPMRAETVTHTQAAPPRPAARAPQQTRVVRVLRRSPAATTAARTGAQAAGKGALVSGAKVAAKGAAGGVLIYGSVEVISQEIDSPGKTLTDIRNGNINPKWNEVGASAAGGAAAAALAAAGVGALPVAVAGAGVYAGILVTEQEMKDPGKTARDIKTLTGGKVDLKKAGEDVNEVAAAVGKRAAKRANEAHKAMAADMKDAGRVVLGLFEQK